MTALHDHEARLIAATKRFVQDYVLPQTAIWNSDQHLPRDAFSKAAAIGLTAIDVPSDLGGMGCSFSTKAKIAEMLAQADFGFSMAVINTQNVARKIADHPSLRVMTSYLPGLMSGERIGCTALTETGAGSDFAKIVTRAEQRGDGWILNGEKVWIAFLVDGRRSEFERGPEISPIGLHTIGSGSFRLNNYEASNDDIVGAPGAAFKSIMNEINGARIYVAAMCCGMMQSAIDFVGSYGTSRQSFGRSLADHQGWRWTLAEAAASLAASQALVAAAASAMDAGEDVQLIAAQTKIVATRMVERHLPAVIHAMGAEGLKQDHFLGRHLVGASVCGLVDGSTAMLLERVAKLI
ncbi:MAG: acyl-CoA/acyl-ACP dehydrogenase, partial [Afipia sp.]|nr:acyl-CoA/acyl-ACP dehydrogenase [Afipia sp.]